MAAITPNTFDPINRYISARLQQGVPIVDADWNEVDDIRRFEVRAFLKWFIGDGVPDASDAFKILGEGSTNDFKILSGKGTGALLGGTDPNDLDRWTNGLSNVGRCLVNGLDVMIDHDILYTAQPMHANQPDSEGACKKAGASKNISALPTPPATGDPGRVAIYLDVWEHLVTPHDDPGLQRMGVDSCARYRREWAVRTRVVMGGVVPDRPVPGNEDYEPGHSYYLLAIITRRLNDPVVKKEDVEDKRRTGVSLSDALNRLDSLDRPSFATSSAEFSPATGTVNQKIALFGQNLDRVTEVRFGTKVATILGTVTSGQMLVHVPVAATLGRITLVYPDGTVDSVGTFGIIPPVFAGPVLEPANQFSPRDAAVGDVVTIRGRNLKSATTTTTVTIGGISTPEQPGGTATQLLVKVPAGIAGLVQIAVTITFATTPTTSSTTISHEFLAIR